MLKSAVKPQERGVDVGKKEPALVTVPIYQILSQEPQGLPQSTVSLVTLQLSSVAFKEAMWKNICAEDGEA